MDISERRAFLRGDMLTAGNRVGTVQRSAVSAVEIWAECFGRNPTEMKPADSYAISALMLQIPGWSKSDKRFTIPLYGRQRGYERSNAVPDFLD